MENTNMRVKELNCRCPWGRKSRSFPFVVALLLALFVPSGILADDSILRDNGYSVYPIDTEAVRMVSEHIKVAVKAKESAAEVRCDFVFENTTGKTVKALVGFPTRVYDPSIDSTREPFSYFESKINGRSVPVRLRKEILTDLRTATDDSYSGEEHPLRYWYTWEAVFPPHDKLKLHNRYGTVFSVASTGEQWFEYILTTGANWKGPIERIVVEVSYESEDELWRRVVNASPEGFKITGNMVRWEFHNHVPRKNIRINERRNKYREFDYRLIPLMNEKSYKGNTRLYTTEDLRIDNEIFWANVQKEAKAESGTFYKMEQLVDRINRLYARLLRNEIFARHGRIFASRDMRLFFNPWREKYPNMLGVAWYTQNPNYSDSLLNETERKNIKFILDYEKSKGWR